MSYISNTISNLVGGRRANDATIVNSNRFNNFGPNSDHISRLSASRTTLYDADMNRTFQCNAQQIRQLQLQNEQERTSETLQQIKRDEQRHNAFISHQMTANDIECKMRCADMLALQYREKMNELDQLEKRRKERDARIARQSRQDDVEREMREQLDLKRREQQVELEHARRLANIELQKYQRTYTTQGTAHTTENLTDEPRHNQSHTGQTQCATHGYQNTQQNTTKEYVIVNAPKKQPNSKHVILIVDENSSMEKQFVLDGINYIIMKQKYNSGSAIDLSVIAFNEQARFIRDGDSTIDIPSVTYQEYDPRNVESVIYEAFSMGLNRIVDPDIKYLIILMAQGAHKKVNFKGKDITNLAKFYRKKFQVNYVYFGDDVEKWSELLKSKAMIMNYTRESKPNVFAEINEIIMSFRQDGHCSNNNN